jgi:hypothetical protein
VHTETCRRDLVNNNKYIFGCMCAFSWYIKDIIAIQKNAWNGKLHDNELCFFVFFFFLRNEQKS